MKIAMAESGSQFAKLPHDSNCTGKLAVKNSIATINVGYFCLVRFLAAKRGWPPKRMTVRDTRDRVGSKSDIHWRRGANRFMRLGVAMQCAVDEKSTVQREIFSRVL